MKENSLGITTIFQTPALLTSPLFYKVYMRVYTTHIYVYTHIYAHIVCKSKLVVLLMLRKFEQFCDFEFDINSK